MKNAYNVHRKVFLKVFAAVLVCQILSLGADMSQSLVSAGEKLPTEITLYALDEKWKGYSVWTDFQSSTLPKSYTLPDDSWDDYDTTDVVGFSDSLVYPVMHTEYGWQTASGSWVWQSWKGDDRIYRERNVYKFQDCVISSDETGDRITVHVVDFATVWSEQRMDDYMNANITPTMTQYQKATLCCQFIAQNYGYGTSYSDYPGLLITGSGDCIASTRALLYMFDKLGIAATQRDASSDAGAGDGHVNVAASLDGKYYIIDAGIDEPLPRDYLITYLEHPYAYWVNSQTEGTITLSYYMNLTNSKTVTVPSSIDGYKVTAIGEGCFKGDSSIEEIILPDTLEKVASYAFANMPNLKQLNFPDSVRSISSYAVYLSNQLESVSIGKNTSFLGNGAFVYAHSLKQLTVHEDNPYFCTEDNVLFNKDKTDLILYPLGKTDVSYTMPDSVTCLHQWAFCGVTHLKQLTFSPNLSTMQKEVFYICDGIDELILPDSLSEIGKESLSNCQSRRIVLPSSIKSIGEYAFYQSTFQEIVLNEGLETIEDNAFLGAMAYSGIIIPSSVTSIGDYAFNVSRGYPSYAADLPSMYVAFPYSTNITIGKDAFDTRNRMIIFGLEGSSAQAYATANQLPYKNLNANGKISLEKNWFVPLGEYHTWNGKPLEPIFSCNTSTSPYFFTKNRGYTMSYTNNNEPGTGTATLTGTGIFEGSFSQSFTIMTSASYTGPLYGDLDDSGTVTLTDARLALRLALRILSPSSFTEDQLYYGDVNGDGEITTEDAGEILKKALKLISSFSVE